MAWLLRTIFRQVVLGEETFEWTSFPEENKTLKDYISVHFIIQITSAFKFTLAYCFSFNRHGLKAKNVNLFPIMFKKYNYFLIIQKHFFNNTIQFYTMNTAVMSTLHSWQEPILAVPTKNIRMYIFR